METVTVELRLPKSVAVLIGGADEATAFEKSAMLLYPYIQKKVISHGRAAELMGVSKRELIEYYNSIGIPYLDQSKDELMRELDAFEALRAQT